MTLLLKRQVKMVKKKKLKSDVLLSCLDVLCRANVTIVDENPHLAAEISQAIESLSLALQSEDIVEKPQECRKKDGVTKYVRDSKEQVVDVFTKEIIYTYTPEGKTKG